MPTLTDYQTETLELLHDPNNTYYSVTDINNYINRARHRIAMKSQCVRQLLSGGMIMSVSINSPGSGYSGTPIVTITGAGQQARATATIVAGAINSITLTSTGWGYITGATVTVTGSGGGSNATFNVTVDNNLTTVIGQEVYPFTLANNIVTNPNFLFQGIQDVVGVLDVACAWGVNAAMKPMLIPKIWSEFQAYLRSYNTGMQTYPTIWSQYGGGSGTAAGGSIYVWPLPSQASQMDWDCWCRPVLLTSPGTPEVIPYSWTTPVCYYAAYLAYSAAQRPEDAQRMHEDYKEKMLEAQAIATAPFVDNYYESDF